MPNSFWESGVVQVANKYVIAVAFYSV